MFSTVFGSIFSKYPKYTEKYHVIDDIIYKRVKITDISIGDCDDPDIYAASYLHEWTTSEQGKWCVEHAAPESLVYTIHHDIVTFGYRVAVMGMFSEKDLIYYYLKWSQT